MQRLSRFAGSLALGHRVCNLFLLWCCVPCFAGLCLWSWTLRTGGRKLATAKKNNLVSLFERMGLFIGLCSNDLYVSLYMSLILSHKSSQDKAKRDAGTSPNYPKEHLGSKKGKRNSAYLLGAEEPVELSPAGLCGEVFDPDRACIIWLRA